MGLKLLNFIGNFISFIRKFRLMVMLESALDGMPISDFVTKEFNEKGYFEFDQSKTFSNVLKMNKRQLTVCAKEMIQCVADEGSWLT